MKAVGIDIGTTTICGILMDVQSGKMLKRYAFPNDAAEKSQEVFVRQQNPEKILERCRELLDVLLEGEMEVAGIGVTGQMHGIVYLNANGEAVSSLITWQDQRGSQLCPDGRTYVEALSEFGGYRLATGFGAVTHYYNTKNGRIPAEAVCFCTIPDYVAMQLAGRKQPLLHASMAASLGMFRIKERVFDQQQIAKAGMDAGYFPQISETEQMFGKYKERIPVSLALGDNQASFLGAVEEGSSVLVNVGTGSQVSVLGDAPREFPALECRPYIGGRYLYVGSSLCGGYAYAMLKGFFEEVLEMCGIPKAEDLYEKMERAGQKAREKETCLKVDTRFQGTREQPWMRGSICDISVDNFKPGALVLGFLEGICKELLEYYQQIERTEEKEDTSGVLTGSGNGIRQNPLLQELICEIFHKPIRICPYEEEAAYGSARFALYSNKIWQDRM